MNARWLIVVAAVAFQGVRPAVLPAAVTAAIERDRASLIELRRDLHQHPEVSGQEARTAKVVADRLRALGLDVRTGIGGHGVVGILTGAKPGPLVAYRADMDAMPSREPDPVAFASLTPGVRHICGHDLHVTVALGLASALSAVRADLTGRVMFIFQPAEERATGARAMLDAGLFSNARPDVIFGLHTSPLPVGALTSKADRMMHANQAAPGVLNDPVRFARARAAIVAALGPSAFSDLSAPPDGFSEDFGHFQAEVPGVFFFLGASATATPHAPSFVIDEGAIEVGVRAMAAVVLDALQPTTFSIPVIDLSADPSRRVVVDREPGQYLGHPTTVLLEDGRTMLAVYPRGHGAGGIHLKRSEDGGRTWSDRLPVPENWASSKETPTIHRVVDRAGRRRLVLFSGLYPIRSSISEDDGRTWTPLAPIGNVGGIVAMASVERVGDGDYLAFFHDDGRFFSGSGKRGVFVVYAMRSRDGGVTWEAPTPIASRTDVDLCEPGVIRSPDGRTLIALLRENRRAKHSFVITSTDEGRTWTAPRELPRELTGDRHVGKYARDGRLFISFRDMADGSPTKGDWVAWVGTFDDIINGRPGEFRVRLMDNTNAWDAAYPGVEVLPDGTIVTTTYGHWDEGEQPYIVSMRLRLDEIHAAARRPAR